MHQSGEDDLPLNSVNPIVIFYEDNFTEDEMTRKDMSLFQMAKCASELSDFSSRKSKKLGCVVVIKHRIISSGCNSNKTSPIQQKYNSLRFDADTPHKIHAETAALKPLIGNKEIDLTKASLYIYRELKNGKPGLARPCPSCMQLIKDLGIRYIHYTTDDGYAEEEVVY